MADITMCNGKECTKKETCYRFKAKPCEYRQSYFFSPPFEIDKKGQTKCEYYWGEDNPEGDIKRNKVIL